MYLQRIILSVLSLSIDRHADVLGDLLITTILIDNLRKLLRADVRNVVEMTLDHPHDRFAVAW